MACTKYELLVNGRQILTWLFEFTFASTNEQTLDWTESELICVQPTGTAWCCLEIRFQVLTRCPTEPIILAGNVIVLRKSLKTICSNLFHWCLKYYRQNDWRKKLKQFENCWRELSRVSLLASLAGSACLCGNEGSLGFKITKIQLLLNIKPYLCNACLFFSLSLMSSFLSLQLWTSADTWGCSFLSSKVRPSTHGGSLMNSEHLRCSGVVCVLAFWWKYD